MSGATSIAEKLCSEVLCNKIACGYYPATCQKNIMKQMQLLTPDPLPLMNMQHLDGVVQSEEVLRLIHWN